MKNKKGFQVEKNFYVTLFGLPQKHHYFHDDDKAWASCDCCKIQEKRKRN